MRKCIKHVVDRSGTQIALLVAILARVVDSKQSRASLLPRLTIWSYLQFAQMPPTSRDLAIFVPTVELQTDYFTPCACAWGNYTSG